MFAVIYRGYVKPNKEKEYRQLWHQIATYFVEKRGALGSCLHKTKEGLWLAYSRWPDKKTRDASWPGEDAPCETLPNNIRQAIVQIKECIDQERQFPEISMEVVDDLLINSPYR
ncbi:antibiotic biosynthesis monooxygenase family protein [Coxiella burnetii]|uniref:ABM domain-containing protein n=1 Tax=Coxiella burnetii (strain RSA 493 / Nine Mile phase I) TaxID=227377 RepID=Q83BN7_COXBU|nr:hypothetical protein [Coxiella burnetii]NP_820449.1 hypothetical protein CBU_1466 [Coxiella burnetii RSA 493]AAO90963.1 hypothetical protein CBU_1466 [Coxiella burnetii RSA 493]ABX78414.1 hypothetical protein COXBURSA331_A1644 [Coxiella burnetii RSA 331]ACJ17961.1 hypothetical protein CbuG_0542 [Coxiella burnetii CbuG_Q212]ACJ20832.1 hypothetical protein CbuK_1697 [Coxiella burnetii CbuK_Q154]AML48640.1 hypothetical protein AUR58_05170 [Coxiella burnetii]